MLSVTSGFPIISSLSVSFWASHGSDLIHSISVVKVGQSIFRRKKRRKEEGRHGGGKGGRGEGREEGGWKGGGKGGGRREGREEGGEKGGRRMTSRENEQTQGR